MINNEFEANNLYIISIINSKSILNGNLVNISYVQKEMNHLEQRRNQFEADSKGL